MQSKSWQHPLKIACFWYVRVKRSLFSEVQIIAERFHWFKSTHHTVYVMSICGCNRLHFFVQWAKCFLITEMVIEFPLVKLFFFVCYQTVFCNSVMTYLIKHILPYIDGHLKTWWLSQSWGKCLPATLSLQSKSFLGNGYTVICTVILNFIFCFALRKFLPVHIQDS